MALTATVQTQILSSLTKTLDVIGSKDLAMNVQYSETFTAGSGNNQVNKRYEDDATIAGSGSISYDLSGALSDGFGDTQVFTKLKVLRIKHLSASLASTITLSGNLLDAVFGGTAAIVLPPGGDLTYIHPTSGVTVTNTSADTVLVTNDDGSNAATVSSVFLGIG